ncbi:hypothetical protein [Lacticaseibacillus nasuensis]|uniref:hypothetical protein n=1 Tax=Lacticaseibacillus nasuensis TaxID=944671 RepID=UPI0006D25F9F|nr:hypothetical protein [Lacticaseibacillus nasuensis]
MRKSWLFLLLVGAALLTPLTPVQGAESTGRITFHPRAPTSSTPDAGRGQGQPHHSTKRPGPTAANHRSDQLVPERPRWRSPVSLDLRLVGDQKGGGA